MKHPSKISDDKAKSIIKTRIKKSLDKYSSEVLFPDKLAKANKLLKGVKLPE